MSVAGALGEGLQVTVVGLCIVFSVLLILMLVLMGMKVIFYKPANKEESTKMISDPKRAALPKAEEPKTDADEGELIAILTAAVAASLNTSTYNLKIKSYRRVGNASPSWNKAGLNDVINSRF